MKNSFYLNFSCLPFNFVESYSKNLQTGNDTLCGKGRDFLKVQYEALVLFPHKVQMASFAPITFHRSFSMLPLQCQPIFFSFIEF